MLWPENWINPFDSISNFLLWLFLIALTVWYGGGIIMVIYERLMQYKDGDESFINDMGNIAFWIITLFVLALGWIIVSWMFSVERFH